MKKNDECQGSALLVTSASLSSSLPTTDHHNFIPALLGNAFLSIVVSYDQLAYLLILAHGPCRLSQRRSSSIAGLLVSPCNYREKIMEEIRI